jgi:putative SbcD/Mre11-related phosphoesterase
MRVHTDWLLTPQRAAVHLPTATVVLADLHLGYAAVRCATGEAVPAASLDELVAALTALRARYGIRRLVIAGDLFEDARRSRPVDRLLRWLRKEGLELTGIVPGNHDHGLSPEDEPLPLCPEGILLGGWRVVHGDGRLPAGRLVQGHIHPCFRWGAQVKAPCFLVGKDRIILPAWSADATGVNVLRGQRWRTYRCCVIVGEEVLDFGIIAALQ